MRYVRAASHFVTRTKDLQIQSELGRHPSGTVTAQSASLDMGHRSLAFEMVSSREHSQVADPQCDTRSTRRNSETSELCDTIVLAIRLSLLQHYRRRKVRLVGQGGPSSPILLPIVQSLQFQSAYLLVESALQMFVTVLAHAGLRATMDILQPVVDDRDSHMVQRILAGQLGVGGTNTLFQLRLEDWWVLSVDFQVEPRN